MMGAVGGILVAMVALSSLVPALMRVRKAQSQKPDRQRGGRFVPD
jgi:hypothetical protein